MRRIIVFCVLLVVSVLALALDAGRALSMAQQGNPSLPPLKLMIVMKYHSPLQKLPSDDFYSSPMVRILLSDLYFLSDLLSKKADLRLVLAVSNSFLEQIRDYSTTGVDKLMDENYKGMLLRVFAPPNGTFRTAQEWNYNWLPPNIKKDINKRASLDTIIALYRMMASSILGKLIAIHEYGKFDVAVVPDCDCAGAFLISRGMKEVVKRQLFVSYEELSTIFGSVGGFFPPMLDISQDLLDILSDMKVDWIFASWKILPSPSYINGIKAFPVDVELSDKLLKIRTEKDLANFMSDLHRLQRAGKDFVALRINALYWAFLDYDVKRAILQALSDDEFVKLVLPSEVNVTGRVRMVRSSEVENLDDWFSQGAILKGWELVMGAFEIFNKAEPYLSEESRNRALDLLSYLADVEFYRALEKGDEKSLKMLDSFDRIMRALLNVLGEDVSKIQSVKSALQKRYVLRVVYADYMNLNGVEDEGFWVYAKEFKCNPPFKYLKLLPLNDGLALSIAFEREARAFVGDSCELEIEIGDRMYKVFFKVWNGRYFVYRRKGDEWILKDVKGDEMSIWEVVEIYLNEGDFPVKIKLTLMDSRRHVGIGQFPEKGYILLDRE